MRKVSFLLVVSMVMIFVSCGSNVQPTNDWPMSGVNPQGNRVIISPEQVKPTEPDILAWLYTATGEICSTPAISKSKLYVGTQDLKMLCLDAGNGQLVWQSEMISNAYGTPCVVGEVACQPTEDGHVYCFDVQSGKQKWVQNTKESISVEATVDGQKLYVPTEKNLYCINVEDGTILWKVLLEVSRGTLVSTDSDRVYCSSCNDLVCLDARDGSILWTDKQKNGDFSSPVVYRGDVYVCLETSADNAKGYNEKKTRSFLCLNPNNGETVWSIEIKAGSDIAFSDKYACINSNRSGEYICIDINEKKTIWTYDSKNTYCSCPFVYDGKFYLTSRRRLTSFEPATGKVIKTYQVLFQSVLVNGKFYFLRNSDQNQMVCIDSGSDVETGMLDYVSEANPRIIGKEEKLLLGVKDGSVVYAFVRDKVKWETTKEWSIVQAQYPGKKNAYFWENNNKIVVLHQGIFSCLDRATGKELWNFNANQKTQIYTLNKSIHFLSKDNTEIELNLDDGKTKSIRRDFASDDLILFESQINPTTIGDLKFIRVLKAGVYLVSVGARRSPFCNHYILDVSGKMCQIDNPDIENGLLKISFVQNKYYLGFGLAQTEYERQKEIIPPIYFETDLSTGHKREILSKDVPADAVELTSIAFGSSDYPSVEQGKTNQNAFDEKEIEKNTGIVKNPQFEKRSENYPSESNVYSLIVGDNIILTRYNCNTGNDGDFCNYDLLAVFEKGTWKKVWDTTHFTTYFEEFHIFGSLLFIDGNEIFDIATGKKISAYSDVQLISKMDDMLLLFATKDNKPKIVVLNLKKIDELKNIKP